MNDLSIIFGFGLATGSLLAYGYVVVSNWLAVLAALGLGSARGADRTGERPSLVLLAGPVLLVALVQGLRMVAPLSGTAVLTVLLAGLLLDPAGLPVLGFLAYRRIRRGRRGPRG